jgi:hypothetical protein
MKLENLNVISKITKKAYNNRRDLLKKHSLGVFQKIKKINGISTLYFKTIRTFNDKKSYDMYFQMDEKWKNAKKIETPEQMEKRKMYDDKRYVNMNHPSYEGS